MTEIRDPTPAPTRTLEDGTRVQLTDSIGEYDGAGYVAKGAVGTVIAYATPELKRKQVWTEESYYVRLDFDPEKTRRVLDRHKLEELAGG